jgi:23S rRNA pseudouridine1911/1915/1917 synthase
MDDTPRPPASRILYQSDRFIIVNKLPGEAAENAGPGITELPRELTALFNGPAGRELVPYAGPIPITAVNRLDVPVSGCVLFARTAEALSDANALFREGAVEKHYLAIVETPAAEASVSLNIAEAATPPQSRELVHWLGEDSRRNKSTAFNEPGLLRKKAILRYRVLGRGERYLFLEIELVTGRRHQIRAQLAAVGLHIKGDLKYGARRSEKTGIRLHAYSLSFRDPHGNRGNDGGLIRVSAPPPVMDRLWQACWDCVTSSATCGSLKPQTVFLTAPKAFSAGQIPRRR